MKKAFLSILILAWLAAPAMGADTQDRRGQCLESTVYFYNCLKGGTEMQRNLSTTYLLGAIQTMAAAGLIVPSHKKTMVNYRFEYLDFVEANGSIHNEPPGRGVVMYLLQTYGDKSNPTAMQLAREQGLIP